MTNVAGDSPSQTRSQEQEKIHLVTVIFFFHHLNFFQVRSVNEHAAVISVDILIYFALSVCRSHSSVKSFFYVFAVRL